MEKTTFSSYTQMVKGKIAPYFRNTGLTLDGIQAKHIQSFYLHELKTVSPGTVIHYHANIHKALKYAVKMDLIPFNPADKVERPKKQRYIVDYYRQEELERLLEASKDHPYSLLIQMTAFYGLRRSEALGLKWDAIDFERNTITITSPFSVLSQWLIGDEVNVVEDFQKQYGYNQQLGIYEKDYIDGSGQSYEGVIFTDGATEVVYYNQLDERWADLPYGTDNIGGYGCGPTSMAIVVSSLTDQTVDPPTMAEWAYQNGYWCSGNGSYHSLIPGAAEGFGLQWESISTDDPQAVVDALASGKLIVALMSKGHFTSSGHFMVLRGVTSEGKILVADPASKKRSEQEWDISIILDEARKGAAAGGPLWAIY